MTKIAHNVAYYYGQYKYGKREGYYAVKRRDGTGSYYQFKNDMVIGYGIMIFYLGSIKDPKFLKV